MELNKLELDLDTDHAQMESVSKRFEKIYSNGFRHRYSEIACMIGEITEDPSQDNHESLDSLGVNLQVLEEYIRTHRETTKESPLEHNLWEREEGIETENFQRY